MFLFCSCWILGRIYERSWKRCITPSIHYLLKLIIQYIRRFRFPRWRWFWTCGIISSGVIRRHTFKLKFRRCKQTWKQSLTGWPLQVHVYLNLHIKIAFLELSPQSRVMKYGHMLPTQHPVWMVLLFQFSKPPTHLHFPHNYVSVYSSNGDGSFRQIHS